MLETPLSDVRQILKRAEIDLESSCTLLQPMTHYEGSGPQRYPSFSPLLVEWLQDKLVASAELRHSQLRSGVMMLVLLMTPQLSACFGDCLAGQG